MKPFYKEGVYTSVSQILLLAEIFWLRRRTTDPHILAYVNIDCGIYV